MKQPEEKIRIRAYQIWEQTGHCGKPEDHWFQAEVELELEQPAAQEAERDAQPQRKVKRTSATK